MPQAQLDLSRDAGSVADLLRTRQEDAYEPPRARVSSDASLERELKLLANCDSFATVTRSGRKIVGLACWTPLAWDSEQLGIPAAKLDLLVSAGGYEESLQRKSALLKMVVEECRFRALRYLTARVAADDLSAIHALGREGFEVVDGILTFSFRLDETVRRTVIGGPEVRLFQSGDLDQILAVARSAYMSDRFHVDRALPPGAADRLYASWVRRSCSGEEADAVLVAVKNGKVVGYVTCKLGAGRGARAPSRLGTIGLVATAEEARGQGIASATLQGALDWFQQHAVDVVEVGTQMQNVAACRLYEQCGFRMARMSLTFRRLI